MSTNFRADEARFFTTPREPDAAWLAAIGEIVDVKGKLALDIGCGEGMFTKALADLGAFYVTGVDISEDMLTTARKNCQGCDRVYFVRGSAFSTGLIAERYDLLLQRALIHDFSQDDVHRCLVEAYRLLDPGGIVIIEDQTPEDCLVPGSKVHVRGYFYERYPELIDQRILGRLSNETVQQALQRVGFRQVKHRKLWETRGTYHNLNALAGELVAHASSSPLQQSSDEELRELVSYISYVDEYLPHNDGSEIVEKDCWTIWSAVKG